jgi:hypothetical protein
MPTKEDLAKNNKLSLNSLTSTSIGTSQRIRFTLFPARYAL